MWLGDSRLQETRSALVLASASPRRRALLARLRMPFTVVATSVDETPQAGEPAEAVARRLAEAKAAAASRDARDARILSADTVVAVDAQPVGKPANAAEATALLVRLRGRAHRVITAVCLTIPGHAEVFVLGDAAAFFQEGKQLPGVAPVAILEGRHTAKSIQRACRGEPLQDFYYRDKGNLATIGRDAAVAQFGPIGISGRLAWVAWLTVHLYFLIGFRNRLMVMFEWAWAYLTYQRGSRLITGKDLE